MAEAPKFTDAERRKIQHDLARGDTAKCPRSVHDANDAPWLNVNPIEVNQDARPIAFAASCPECGADDQWSRID